MTEMPNPKVKLHAAFEEFFASSENIVFAITDIGATLGLIISELPPKEQAPAIGVAVIAIAAALRRKCKT